MDTYNINLMFSVKKKNIENLQFSLKNTKKKKISVNLSAILLSLDGRKDDAMRLIFPNFAKQKDVLISPDWKPSEDNASKNKEMTSVRTREMPKLKNPLRYLLEIKERCVTSINKPRIYHMRVTM